MFNIKRQCHEVLIIPAYFEPVRVLCPKKTGFFEKYCSNHDLEKIPTLCNDNSNICVAEGCFGRECVKEN